MIVMHKMYKEMDWLQRKRLRLKYIEVQENKCMWCGNSLSYYPTKEILETPIDETLFPKNMFDHPIHLQHCHKTGLTEWAVHARCNAVMRQYYNR